MQKFRNKSSSFRNANSVSKEKGFDNKWRIRYDVDFERNGWRHHRL